mgnify:CR=1 FL=1
MSRYNLYINDILRAISDIEETTKNKNFNAFSKDKNLVDATAMRIQIIGESIKKIPEDLKKKEKQIKWNYLESLRNIKGLRWYNINFQDRLIALEHMKKYNLDYEDAITLQSAISSSCKEILSLDKHFDKIKEVKRISP